MVTASNFYDVHTWVIDSAYSSLLVCIMYLSHVMSYASCIILFDVRLVPLYKRVVVKPIVDSDINFNSTRLHNYTTFMSWLAD